MTTYLLHILNCVIFHKSKQLFDELEDRIPASVMCE